MENSLLKKMNQKTYEYNYDYLLDVLDKSYDLICEELSESLSDDAKFLFEKLLAVQNEITNLNIEKAYDLGCCDSNR